MTETTGKQAAGAFEKFLGLLGNIERTKKQARLDFEKATKVLAITKKSYAAAELNHDAELIDDKELKQAAKDLEAASRDYDAAKLRFEASMSPDAFNEVVAPGSKGRKLAEEAAAEAQKAMDELRQERDRLMGEITELQEKYLALAEEYFTLQADEKDISRQLQQIADVIPDIVPQRYVRMRERGFLQPWQLPIVDAETINKRIHKTIASYRSGKY
jgi:chromosome segregation ATPase